MEIFQMSPTWIFWSGPPPYRLNRVVCSYLHYAINKYIAITSAVVPLSYHGSAPLPVKEDLLKPPILQLYQVLIIFNCSLCILYGFYYLLVREILNPWVLNKDVFCITNEVLIKGVCSILKKISLTFPEIFWENQWALWEFSRQRTTTAKSDTNKYGSNQWVTTFCQSKTI